VLDATAEELGDRPFFLSEQPSSYDATVYAFAAGVLCPAFDHAVRRHAAGKANLVAYERRLRERSRA
jgi:glutathione S-transferase